MKDMVIGSHNSWSYLRPRRWWMRAIGFAARCQRVDVRKQYWKYGVRCFDLRIRLDAAGVMIVAHGAVEYVMMSEGIWDDLKWLDEKGDCYVRVLHEARTRKQYTDESVKAFRALCHTFVQNFQHTQFWCGRNLFDWQVDYEFGEEPTCDEIHGSVVKGKWLYGWWPWLYAVTHNGRIYERGTDKDVLLVDFVDILMVDYE